MFDTMVGLTTSVFIILVLASQFRLSMQACAECACCKGSFSCDSNKNCIDGCIDGYYGEKCTDECPENCKTCFKGYECTECKPGYYTNKCNLQCGKGCLNNTCSFALGECKCKSTNFTKGKCDACSGLMYGDQCNNTCPTNCGSCISDKECPWCINTIYYGSYCQHTCSVGCVNGKCNKGNGTCTDGCKPSFSGVKCDKCSPGFYGRFCDLNCTDNCFSCLLTSNCTVCKSGFYGETCTKTCPSGCNENCSLADGKCFYCRPGFVGEFCDPCKDGKYGVNCSKSCNDTDSNCKVCSTNELGIYYGCMTCNSGHYPVIPHGLNYRKCLQCPVNCKDKTCNTAGVCTHGCVRGKWGDKCNFDCKRNCVECDQNVGTCLECTYDTYSDNCSNNCSSYCNRTGHGRVCENNTGSCLQGCESITRYGEYCENICNSTCINQSCGYEGQKCVLAIKGAESKEKKSVVIVASSAGAGVVVIVLLVILSICLIKRNRRQKLSSNTKCEENDYVLDMKEIPKQIDKDEPGVIYAKPFKPKQEAGGDAGKEYDTAYDGDQKIPGIDNGYTAVNIGTSANEQNKSFEVCDIAYDNKSYKPLGGNDDYAVVNKGNSTVKENECFEEVYDTTHDNKKNKQPLSSNNDYAVLSVRSDNIKGFSKSNLAQQDDVYDSAEGGKHITLHRPNNDYAVFNCNNGDKHENDKANTLYDTKNDMKMRPVNNDYDFCELEND